MPREKQIGDRVIGVYGRRLVIFADGERVSELLPTESAALKKKEVLEKEYAQRAFTIETALGAWIEHKRTLKAKERTLVTSRNNVKRLLPERWGALAELTPGRCRAAYEALWGRFAVATHHASLASLQEFLLWCVGKGWLKKSPAEGIQPEGTANKGKPQLTLDEARLLFGGGLARLARGEYIMLAPLACLLMGLRISELTKREVRDLDDGGRVLVIPHGKTLSAKRRVVIPAELRPAFEQLARGRVPLAPLFPHSRAVADYALRKLCKEVGVLSVCLHSLRGLHADLAIREGETGALVARALGHDSFTGTTLPHYVQPGTLENTNQGRVLRLFSGNDSRSYRS